MGKLSKEAADKALIVHETKRRTEEEFKDLAARIQVGQLTPEEEQELKALATMVGKSVGDVMQALRETFAKVAPQMQSVGAQMNAVAEQIATGLANDVKQRVAQNRADRKPLARWSTVELVALLPEKAKAYESLGELDDFQLACALQHCLNNCTAKDGVTYEGALQLKYGPEVVNRLAYEKSEPVRLQTAWQLYRTGAATLEEITPIMDQACGLDLANVTKI